MIKRQRISKLQGNKTTFMDKKEETKNETTLSLVVSEQKTDILNGIFLHFIRFLSLKENINVFQTAKIYRHWSHIPKTWGVLLHQHYGDFYIRDDFHRQYQASFLLAKAQQTHLWKEYSIYEKLQTYVKSCHTPETKWTFYYFGHLATLNYSFLEQSQSSVEYALTALTHQDKKAYPFLMTYFKSDPLNTSIWRKKISFNVTHLTQFLEYIENEEMDIQQECDRCLVKIMMANHTNFTGDRRECMTQQINIFFELMPKMDLQIFLNFLIDILMVLNLTFRIDVTQLKREDSLQKATTQLNILMHASIYSRIRNHEIFIMRLHQWLEELAVSNAIAAYYYAHHVLARTDKHLETKKFLIRAMEGLEWRAFANFHALYLQQGGVINKKEYKQYLVLAAIQKNELAVSILLKEKNWWKNVDYVWIMLNYVLTTHDSLNIKNEFLRLENSIEKSGLLIRCALSLFYAVNNDLKLASIQFDIAMAGNSAIISTFLIHGKKLGLCNDNHRKLLTDLQEKYTQNAASKKTTRRSY